jgi:CheY-like chemotaxis protein
MLMWFSKPLNSFSEDDPMLAQRFSAKLENAMSPSRPVVLVVEDHVLIRQGALDIVNSAGFEALEAQSADEAIMILESRTDIRLVFTDVEMPGTMDGLKLVHYIRERWPPVHLIVASGKAILAESQLPTGAKFFFKPYDETSIIEMMTKMLAEPPRPQH